MGCAAMNGRNFSIYWYHRKIFKVPNGKPEDMTTKNLEMDPKTSEAAPGPTKKSKIT